MSNAGLDKSSQVLKAWIALRRLDKNDEKVVALREVSFPPAADVAMIIQIITTTFGLNSPDVIFKIRNHRGCLIPLNSSIPANSKHMPYVLEVAKIFQHVCPKPRTIPMTVINKSMKTRLQSIDRRIPVFYYRFREWRTFCLRSNSGAMKNLARRLNVSTRS
ncbi:uncharacterized protein si:zfos-1056e6.1 isoform X3 [Xiphias gladius]|uniref:uncharacterized protein si:zfos-1056e6.1 isoform X3 n=1 Tax=Xiphias gladius TaxID=8245 RepID=UPI001A986AD7|nr:uncharacterized protein si:zfos-1056e6.1 isoform X3 [Xiphias gladius]